ncbi:sugar phosphate nucleotidyltransferase [Kitasatospora sp. MAP5-34]|uniref:sugar phosphate nucleotidyltransferase n=1 Tax=Kitasatospora sp. MAP5-34 TaxID=3035102 RepID=UPI002475957D|nr:sugar phosphate nucleotidyltransferase [Kitasatospora sp. MAP5-34]MDH6579149.1 ADP-glucose pyrophosphorylase [Kitasatospora sp. MAP5-34]
MSLDGVRAGLLAGGLGERMGPLTSQVCKPLVPYAASCRLVDFSVANAVRSGVPEVVLLSLHRESDLVHHLLTHWDDRPGTRLHFGPHDRLLRTGDVHRPGTVLPPRPAERGTADALLANAEYLFAPGASDLLVQHADHVYHFDYGPMLAAHRSSGADCTIGVQPVEPQYVKLFGMVEVDAGLRVRSLVEKPQHPTSDLVFTAFCLFRIDALRSVLTELAARGPDGWQHDISRDVLPEMIARGRRVTAFPVEGYWADIGTVERYHREQLRLLARPHAIAPESLPRTLVGAAPRFAPDTGSLLGAEVPAGAMVEQSVLHPGCRVEPGAKVLRSVVLPGATVAAGATVRDGIVLAGEVLAGDRFGMP